MKYSGKIPSHQRAPSMWMFHHSKCVALKVAQRMFEVHGLIWSNVLGILKVHILKIETAMSSDIQFWTTHMFITKYAETLLLCCSVAEFLNSKLQSLAQG